MRSRPLAGMLIAAVAAVGFAACSSGGDDDDPTGPGSSSASGAGGEGNQGGTGAAGGDGGTGGTVIVEGSGEDTCPGDPYEIDWGQTFLLKGDTSDATDDYSSFCGDITPEVDGPDLVYAITIAQAGTFTVELSGTGEFLPAITIRTACDDDQTAYFCFEFDTQEKIAKQHIEAGTYYVFVDHASMGGAYELTLSLDEPVCGDGVLAPAEELCDPIPVAPNDGCTDPGDPLGGCKYEMPEPTTDTCPGETFQVTTAGLKLLATDGHTTLGYIDDYIGSCQPVMGGKDRVYQLVPQTTGTMTVSIGFEEDGTTPTCMVNPTLEGCWDHALHARLTCDLAATELDCSDTAAPEVLSFPVVGGTPYFVIVDGYDGEFYSDGTFNLIVTLQ